MLMRGDGISVVDERTVATSAVAAIAAIGEERRGEHGQPGGRVRVTRLTLGDRPRMQLDDLAVTGMTLRQPLCRRLFQVVIAKLRHDVQRYRLGSLTNLAP